MKTALMCLIVSCFFASGCGDGKNTSSSTGRGGTGDAGGMTTSLSTGGGGTGDAGGMTTSLSTGGGGTGDAGGCHYPQNDEFGYFPSSGTEGAFLPLLDEAEKGGSASRLGPWATDRTFMGVSLVIPTSGITELPIAIWTQVSTNAVANVPLYQTMQVVASKNSGDVTYYTFAFPIPLIVPMGESVFVAEPLNAPYYPIAYVPGACYDPTRTWWYGRTIQQGCGADGASCEEGASCTTGFPGICRTGKISCSGNEANCVQVKQPVAEISGNGKDDNCNGIVDEDSSQCEPETEICDGKDNDCDGVIDNGCPDADGDGFPVTLDCDDADQSVHPGAPEVCGNGKDDNCNGIVDDPSPGLPSWAMLKYPGDPSVSSFSYDFPTSLVEQLP